MSDRTGSAPAAHAPHAREHRGLLRAVLESMGDGVAMVAPDGRLMLYNQRFRELWGFDEALLRSGDDDAALDRASGQTVDPEAFIARVRELYGKPQVRSLEDVHFADGRTIQRHGGPVHEPDGRYVGHLWTFRDVTELRRDQAAQVRAAKMRLDLLERLEHTSRALGRALTPTQVLVVVLREGVDALGADSGFLAITSEDDATLEVRRIDAGSDRVEFLGEVPVDAPLPIAESARTGTTLLIGDNEELRCNHPSLRRMNEQDHACATLPLISGGAVQAVLNIGFAQPRRFDQRDRDLFSLLADRAGVALERAMLNRELEQRAQASYALAYVADGVFTIDDRGVVQLWNRAAESILGIHEADAVGTHVASLVREWDRIAEAVPVTDADGEAPGRSVRVTVTGRDDQPVTISVSAVRGPSGVVYAFRDVTHDQRLERAKSDFVATVSHELRTPVTTVMGAAQTLQRSDIELDDATRASLLDAIVSESERLASIAGQVLLAGKVDAGVVHHDPERLDVRDIAQGAADALGRRRPDADLELEVPEATLSVFADGDKLRQVLDNLLDNAVKYSPGAPRIHVACRQAGAQVFIDVRDEGIGIPLHEQRDIFEKFYRADPSMSRGVGGAGLGLYVARELVAAMGGRLSVESRGGGSTFTVCVPAAD